MVVLDKEHGSSLVKSGCNSPRRQRPIYCNFKSPLGERHTMPVLTRAIPFRPRLVSIGTLAAGTLHTLTVLRSILLDRTNCRADDERQNIGATAMVACCCSSVKSPGKWLPPLFKSGLHRSGAGGRSGRKWASRAMESRVCPSLQDYLEGIEWHGIHERRMQ